MNTLEPDGDVERKLRKRAAIGAPATKPVQSQSVDSDEEGEYTQL